MPFKDVLMSGSADCCRAAVEMGVTSAHAMRMPEPSSQEHGLSPRSQGARQDHRVNCSNSVEREGRNEGWM